MSLTLGTFVRRNVRWLAGLAVLALVGLSAQPASARMYRWSSPVVSVSDCSGYGASVRLAIRWWNAAPGRLRFVPRRCGRRARIRIVSLRRRTAAAGWGTYPPGGRVLLNGYWLARPWMSRVDRANIVAHELGHAIGLTHHSSRCSLMYAGSADLGDCRKGVPRRRLRCGPQRADVAASIRRYGGRLGRFRGTLCGRHRATTPDRPEPIEHSDDIGTVGPVAPGSSPDPGPDGQPPAHAHRVSVYIDNVDDETRVYLNGILVGAVGYGQAATYDLGILSDEDRITLQSYNLEGGYTWGWSVYSDGQVVAQEREGAVGHVGANGNDQTRPFTTVRRVTYGAHGTTVTSAKESRLLDASAVQHRAPRGYRGRSTAVRGR